MIRSTLTDKPTCFAWSYMIGERVQLLKYKRVPDKKVNARWSSKFMAWIALGKFEVRLHL